MNPLNQIRQDFTGKKVLIFGLGLLGRGVGDARFFHELGCQVKVTDQKSSDELTTSIADLADLNLDYTLGKHLESDINWADVIIRNASVPWDHPLLDIARTSHKPIYMDTQLFVAYSNILTIGVTGTRGKTTTTHMIYQVLRDHYKGPVHLGGNVMGVATLPLLTDIKSQDEIAVLELSSWQLQAFDQYHQSPNLAVITNLYPDHLNTYPSLSSYYQDKRVILQHQSNSDHAFLNNNVPKLKDWASAAKATTHWFDVASLPAQTDLKVLGTHNLENAAAAYVVCLELGIKQADIISSLNQFTGIQHRLEVIRTFSDITFINDTTATTPIACIKAIQSIKTPITLIVGGTDKKLPVDELVKVINSQVDQIILLKGNGTDRIKHDLDQTKIKLETDQLDEAVVFSKSITPRGGTVLLSPAFTSFGSFNNEFDRGQQFVVLVQGL